MKDEYVLYLDESEFGASKTFAIAGIAVKKEKINILQQGIGKVKEIIWSEEYVRDHNPVLHCTELQKVYARRNQKNATGFKEEYEEFIKCPTEDIEKKYTQVYGRISQILKASEATTFACVIKLQQLNDLYYLDEFHNGVDLIDDKYNIALQRVIENYTHYLTVNDGYGDVVYESRNSTGENSFKSPDVKLVNDYHKIQANNKGIVYTNCSAVQSRNRTIMVYSKNDSIAGLEIADFVAYNILKREQCEVGEQMTDFMKLVHRLSYNGGYELEKRDQRSFWGIRVLPSCLNLDDVLKENKRLKNAYAGLKKEKNRLNRNVKKNKEIIQNMQEKIFELEKELEKIKV